MRRNEIGRPKNRIGIEYGIYYNADDDDDCHSLTRLLNVKRK